MRPDGQWQGGKANAPVPYFVAPTQQDAEDMMCAIAMEMGESQVLTFALGHACIREWQFGPAQAMREWRRQG